jgi:hypothetical protein
LPKKKGTHRGFLKGSNSSCRQHARMQWELYKKCEEADVPVHLWVILQKIWDEMEDAKDPKESNVMQETFDGKFTKLMSAQEFSRESILQVVAQLIACDDQVDLCNSDRVSVVSYSR